MTFPVVINSMDGTTCKSHEFTTIFGISGYISTHDHALPTYKPSQKCFLTIEAPAAYIINMQAVQFNLGYTDTGNCHGDSLFIFDVSNEQATNNNEIETNLFVEQAKRW